MVKKTVSLSFKAVLLKWGDDVHSTYRAHGFKSAFSCRGLFRVTRLWLYPGWGTEVPEFSPQFARTYTYNTVDGRNLAPVEVDSLSHDLQGFVIHPRWLGMGFLPSRISGILGVDPRVPSPAVGGSFCWRWIQHHHYQPQQISMRRSRNVSWWRRVNWWFYLPNTGRLFVQANVLISFRKLRKELDSTD